MRIGILTLPFNGNYGGLLQAYALQNFLRQRGHDVYSIQQPLVSNRIILVKQFLKKVIFGTPNINKVNMTSFQHDYMVETDLVRSNREIESVISKYSFDAVVVGSDQVWRFLYIKHSDYKSYFLDFIQDDSVKKIAFAASFGVDFWEADKRQTEIASQLLKRFDAVSVREKSGVDLIETYLAYNDAVHLFDPTLLHSGNFYRRLYNGTETDISEKIGVYFLRPSEQKRLLVQKLSEYLKIQPVVIGMQTKVTGNKTEHYYQTVAQWIKNFDTAKYIITDSFHGTVFSILFKKPFYVLGDSGVTRLESLLDPFNLNSRLLDLGDENSLNKSLLKAEIDYSIFDKVISANLEKVRIFFSNVGL